MDSHSIKLQGRAEIPEPLVVGDNYRVEADCTITQEAKNDNHDGSFDYVYKAEPVTVTIVKSNGSTIKATDPRKNSQKIRNRLFKVYTDNGITEPFDEVYDAYTLEINMLAEALLEGAIKRLNDH